jgi:hypothetical protein
VSRKKELPNFGQFFFVSGNLIFRSIGLFGLLGHCENEEEGGREGRESGGGMNEGGGRREEGGGEEGGERREEGGGRRM